MKKKVKIENWILFMKYYKLKSTKYYKKTLKLKKKLNQCKLNMNVR